MGDLLDKLGIFDLFSMLLPGVVSIISFVVIVPSGRLFYENYRDRQNDLIIFLISKR